MNDPPRTRMNVADFMLVGLTPALIMVMLGSFVIFVFRANYQGPYAARGSFIFAMYVIGVVGIARISMDHGKEHAVLFSVPMALVMFAATYRFTGDGFLPRPLMMLVGVLGLGLIWWLAHWLTWNCTLLDASDADRGEGLLQHLGIDEERVVDDDWSDRSDEVPATPDVTAESGFSTWWRSLVERARRKRAPGITVVYFALAALPLFGIGQWFLRTDADRQTGFRLLVLFVASGVGLLMTTSFLSLRIYLQRRRIELSTPVSVAWLVGGAALLLAILLISLVLPRPGAPLGSRSSPFAFRSPDDLRTQPFAVGNDGPIDEANGRVTRQEQQPGRGAPGNRPGGKSGGQAPKGNEPSGGSQAGSQGKQSATGKSSSGGQSLSSGQSSSSGKPSGSGRSSSRKSSSGEKPSGGKSSGGKSSSSSQSSSAHESSLDGNQKSERGEPSRDGRGGRSHHGERSGDGEKARQGKPGRNDSGGKGDPSGKRDGEGERGTRRTHRVGREQNDGANRSRSSRSRGGRFFDHAGNRSGDRLRASSDQSTLRRATSLAGGMAALLRYLFLAALAVVAGFLLWRYRAELLEGWRQLVADMRRWWAAWFGKKRVDAEREDGETHAPPAAPQKRRFAQFVNPFRGATTRMTAVEVIRYTFEAVEVWADEQGIVRPAGMTPFEFVQQVGSAFPELRRDVVYLGKLYGEAAYAPQGVDREATRQLARLWEALERHAAHPPSASPADGRGESADRAPVGRPVD